MFDPNSGNIHVNRAVIFKEHENWEWETAENTGVQVTEQFIIENYTADTPDYSDHAKISENEFTTTTPPSTPLSTHQTSEPDTNGQSGREDTTSSGTSSNNSDPKHFRLLTEIYDTIAEIELADELLLMGIDEPVSFEQEEREDV